MKKLSFLIFILVVLFLIGGGFYWFYRNSVPLSNDVSSRYFLINKGASASQIGSSLEKSGFIKSALAFRIYVKFSGNSKKILAGEYRLSPSFSLSDIVDQFLHGPEEIWVTIPEGLRIEEVAVRFTEALAKDAQFVEDFLAAGKGKEGFLFPDTYLFPQETTAEKIVEKMLATFDKKVDLKIKNGDIILASLVERETKTAEERPIVAGILLNRIKIGMSLQVDATVQYVVGTSQKWWPVLSQDDLKIKSPYNTYTNLGLPPTPICNPGLSSIKAAVYPAKTDFLYYLHDLNGAIHYARTFEEHNQNIRQYLSP
jgi:UPF0755 protein